MAMALGLENKKQLRLLAILLAVIVLVGGFELYQELFSSPSRPRPVPPPAAASVSPAPVAQSQGPEAARLTNAGIDPTLHTEKLRMSESIVYAGSGRNIFFAGDAGSPLKIEQPIKSPRRVAAPVKRDTGPPPPPKPPAIDLKYFGYTMLADKSLQAFFIHGEDIFMARPGEIINHRYKVGIIRPNTAEVTDLPYNNKQILTLISPER